MSQVLELASIAAEDVAARLTHWQVLDIVHVYREGRIKVSPQRDPWPPLAALVADGVLKRCANFNSRAAYLVPGHRFRAVLESLWRSGRVQRAEVQ